MKKIGIICEFNPFHNGHKYFIDEVKKRYPDSLIILALSGNFTERGDISILSKSDKVRLSLDFGVDLVLEVPTLYVTNSADYFGLATVKALNDAGVDLIVCGSETADKSYLYELANNFESSGANNVIKSNVKTGKSYAESCFEVIGTSVKSNDILAISYIKAVRKINPNMDMDFIKRTNSFLDLDSTDSIISAQNIRKRLLNGETVDSYVPSKVCGLIKRPNFQKMFGLLKYKVLTTPDLNVFLGADEGLSVRLLNGVNMVSSIDELLEYMSTKRFSKSRCMRFIIHVFLGHENQKFELVNYTRILGFNKRGQSYLNEIKSDKLVYKVNDNIRKSELIAAYFYDEVCSTNEFQYEKRNMPIIKESE